VIRKIDLKENEVLNYNNCIYSDYKCNCTKDWKEHNKVIVYYLDKESCVKLLDEPTENIFDYCLADNRKYSSRIYKNVS